MNNDQLTMTNEESSEFAAVNSELPVLQQSSERRIVAVAMSTRAVHDVAARMVYPFLPDFAKGLGITIEQMGGLIALRNGVGIVAPAFGALSDRVGHRRSAMLGLMVLGVGLLITGVADGMGLAAIGFILSGLGSAIFIPTLIAYVSDRVPFARRGRVTGAIEMTWGFAGMIGVPIIGLIITAIGWRAPFILLGSGAFVGAGLLLLLEESREQHILREALKLAALRHNRSALAFIATWFLVFFAFENIQVGYAAWLAQQFGLSTAARGTVQILFGVFEITASFSSALFLDRIGKKRGVTGGLIVVLIGYVLLATLGSSALPIGLLAISIAFLGFEFSVVSGVPIMGEQIPTARGTMIALALTAGSVGRMIADWIGSALVSGAGFPLAALISAIAALITVVVFTHWVKESVTERAVP
ncbi:MAG TPA: MFS transporter [Anaerolineae bacterium]|nr:MFS transporter [Anaerolineae bacterium]